jgi:hypothetical protein
VSCINATKRKRTMKRRAVSSLNNDGYKLIKTIGLVFLFKTLRLSMYSTVFSTGSFLPQQNVDTAT